MCYSQSHNLYKTVAGLKPGAHDKNRERREAALGCGGAVDSSKSNLLTFAYVDYELRALPTSR